MTEINPKQIKVPFTELNKIIHISDIHIRLFKRHQEYREVFETLYEELKLKGQLFEDSIIIVSGDVLHCKTDLSPEMVVLASNFLRRLADISTTIVIAGNHDLNLSNSFRLDSITPLIKNISHPNLYYLKNSGIYTIADTDFALFSIIGDKKEWPKLRHCKSPNKIALMHAPVNNSKTDTGYTITSRHADMSMFNGYDLVLLGDIHKHQILQEYDKKNKSPLIAYCGSLIQQNHGENLQGHGWLEWDVKNRSFEFHELKNEYGYATVVIENDKMPDLSHIPSKPRLRIFVKDLDTSKIKKIESIIRKKFNIQEFVVNKMCDVHSTSDVIQNVEMINVHDIEIQNSLIEEYLSRNSSLVDNVVMDRIFEINRQLNSKIASEELPRNIRWKPLSFEFSNMFSYGNDNILDFESMSGVHGLFSPNATGKTASFDALMFCLYDKTPRAFKASHIMNNRKNKFKSLLRFEINGVEYSIKRNGKRKPNGDVKVEVDFWKNEGGIDISLNAEDRRSTNAVIRKYVGTYEDFILTNLSLQNNNALFIDKSQSERKDLLSQFMGINIFDLLYQQALDEMKEATGAIKMMNRENTAHSLTDVQTEIESLTCKYNEIDLVVRYKKEELDNINSTITRLYEKKAPLDLETVDIGKLESTKEILSDELRNINTNFLTLKQQSVELRNQSGSLSDSIEMYNDMDIITKHEDMVKSNNMFQEVQGELKLIISKIETKQSQFDHMIMHDFDPNCEFCVKNNNKLAQTTSKLQKDLLLHKMEQDKIEPRVKELKDLMGNYSDVMEDFSMFRKIQSNILNVDLHLLKICTNISDLNNKIITKKNKLKEIEQNIKKYYKVIDLIQKNAKIEEEIGIWEQKQDELEQELKLNEIQLRGLHGQLQVQKSLKTKILQQLTDMEDLEKTIHAYQYYIEAIRRNGIPYELISKIIPFIESEVNNILSQIVDFKISLEVDGKNINGKMVYDDDRHWPLEMASGMERFISSLAIRVALITISNLPKPSFLIIDEGLGALSSENLISMHTLFSILKNQFEFIIIISHLDVVQDIADHLIEIQVENGYSKINY